MMKLMNNKGFASFVEVMVTSIIFVIASYGIFAAISGVNPSDNNSLARLEAAYIGKQVLEDLRTQVDARTWDDALANDLTPPTYGPINITGVHGTYTVSANISSDDYGYSEGLRRVELTVDY